MTIYRRPGFAPRRGPIFAPRTNPNLRPGFISRRAGLGQVFESLGVTMWEWLNPEQRAAEFEAIGKPPPAPVEFGDVIGAAMEDTRDVVTSATEEITEGAETIVGGASKMALGLGAVAVIAGLVYLSRKGGRK